MKLAIIAAMVAFAPTAFAACPPEQLQKAVDLNVQANKLASNGDLSAIVAGLEANRQACLLDPFVMLVDARSWIALATRTSDKAALTTFADRALSSLLASERQTNVSVGGQRPAIADGKPIQIVIGVNRDLAQGVVEAALATERIIGRTLPSNPPPGPDVPVQPCDSNAVTHASAAADHVKAKGRLAGRPQHDCACVRRLCAESLAGRLHPNVYGAQALQALQAMAERNPEASGLLEPMLKAARDIDGVGEAGRTGPLTWDAPARGRFARAFFAVASANKWTMPVEQWFTPDNLNKSWTNVAMGVALDRAWAEGHATGGDLRTRTDPYKTLFVAAYSSAANSPETTRKLAKDTLYLSARRHAEGTYRGKGNEALDPATRLPVEVAARSVQDELVSSTDPHGRAPAHPWRRRFDLVGEFQQHLLRAIGAPKLDADRQAACWSSPAAG